MSADGLPCPDMRYVTACTPDAYAHHATQLAESLRVFGRSLTVHELPPRELWTVSAAAKARVMLRELEACLEPVCWLDADCRVLRDPQQLELRCMGVDMAAHWRDGQELLSGTLVLGWAGGLEIARRWVAACEAQPDQWDQRMLAAVWPSVPWAVVRVLPAQFCYIAEFMPHVDPGDVVIEHLQHSRQLRREIQQIGG